MKKLIFILLAVLTLSCNTKEEEQCDCSQYDTIELAGRSTGSTKVTICHKGQTIEVSQSALQAHLDHGDAIGECTTLATEDYEYDPCYNWCKSY